MYCNACGKAITEEGRFCAYCGTVVGIFPTPKNLTRRQRELLEEFEPLGFALPVRHICCRNQSKQDYRAMLR